MSGDPEHAITPIKIDNLIVNPKTRQEIVVGDLDSLERVSKEITDSTRAVWNEEEIVLMNRDPSMIVRFRPELNPSVAMFFLRDERRRGSNIFGDKNMVRVWEGDYEPVEFTRANLVKFLRAYLKTDDPKLLEAIQNLKVRESHTRTETLIDLSDDNFEATEKQVSQTNIPAKFTLDLPLIETPVSSQEVVVTMQFEATVVSKKDDYGREQQNKKVIVLRCLNARQVLRDVMKGFLTQLPETIPKYYGKLNIERQER